jgi:uncharacterized protein YcbK (DUF882 family)
MNKTTEHPKYAIYHQSVNRRLFLKLGAMATAAALTPMPVLGAIERVFQPEKNLSFFNTHTGESLASCYFRSGRYNPAALKDINYILRDHRTGSIKAIETHLLDILHALSVEIKSDTPFHVISGYRSPKSNAILHRKSKKVASGSLHMKGKAIDIRLPGCRTDVLRKTALKLRAGGVGYYPRRDFIHIDTGRVRYW